MNRRLNTYLGAAVAGLVAGSSLLSGLASAQSAKGAAPKATDPPAKAEKNACGGKDGCGAAPAEKHACKGHNACKGKGGCKSGDNGCAGKNSCKGKGGCAVPVAMK